MKRSQGSLLFRPQRGNKEALLVTERDSCGMLLAADAQQACSLAVIG